MERLTEPLSKKNKSLSYEIMMDRFLRISTLP